MRKDVFCHDCDGGCQGMCSGFVPVEEQKLRKCPFCNGKASSGYGKRRKDGEWLWKPFAGCKECVINRSFETFRAALDWWNGSRSDIW